MEIQRTKGATYTIDYHLVWCPKYRRQVLNGQIVARLQRILAEIASEHGFEILACEIMSDHVHLFVSAAPKHSPAYLAKLFKGITARRLRQQEGKQLQHQIWESGTLWSPSYYVGTAGDVSAEVIKRTIEESQQV